MWRNEDLLIQNKRVARIRVRIMYLHVRIYNLLCIRILTFSRTRGMSKIETNSKTISENRFRNTMR